MSTTETVSRPATRREHPRKKRAACSRRESLGRKSRRSRNVEKSLLDIDFAALTRGPFTPSPAAWEDQVLYFLMLDRFSDGNENGGYADAAGRPVETGTTPLYRPEDEGRVDYDTWFRAGGGWQGGTIKGLTSKLGYLRRLGVTALWVSPPFRQVAFEPSYHGYGIQNFLDVDPHFGTREEFRDFVRAAHEQGIYVILDVIAHHTGNVFTYDADRYPTRDPDDRAHVQRPALGRQALRRGRLQRPRGPADPPLRHPRRDVRRRRRPAGGVLARRRHLAARVPARRPVPPEGPDQQLGPLPRVRRGGHGRRPQDAGRAGALGRAVPPPLAGDGVAVPRLLLLDRLRRPRRLSHRRRQAHGRRCASLVLRLDPRVRSEHREGAVPAGRRGAGRARPRLGGGGADRPGRGPRDRRRARQAGADGDRRGGPDRLLLHLPQLAAGRAAKAAGTGGTATRW